MPPYFSLSLEVRRSDIRPMFINDVHTALHNAGIIFKSGYYDSKDMSLDEITEWNQKKLEADFELGYDEHYSHDYKQSLYEFGGFSEVRGYWFNYPSEDLRSYEIIVPEVEMLEKEDDYSSYDKKAVGKLIGAAVTLWQCPLITSIQTALEIDCGITPWGKTEQGMPPNIRPFAIIPSGYAEKMDLSGFDKKEISRNGILIVRQWGLDIDISRNFEEVTE